MTATPGGHVAGADDVNRSGRKPFIAMPQVSGVDLSQAGSHRRHRCPVRLRRCRFVMNPPRWLKANAWWWNPQVGHAQAAFRQQKPLNTSGDVCEGPTDPSLQPDKVIGGPLWLVRPG